MTVVVAVPVLLPGFGSVEAVAPTALWVIVLLFGVLPLTLTTRVKTATCPAVTVALDKITLPVPPTAGAAVDQPVPVVTVADTNVVFAGTASVRVTVCASDAPLFT